MQQEIINSQPNRCADTSPSHPAIDFEHAYRAYNRRVYAKCLHMVKNEAEAEDLTQEVFLQVFRKLDTFRGDSAFSTWLYRVAVNIVLARLRRKSRITNSLEEAADLDEGGLPVSLVLGAPDRELSSAIERLNLECAFSQMPAGYRQVFLMHDLEGYEHHEIARILGFSVGTSKSQLYKARVWLREALRTGIARPPRGCSGGRRRPFSPVPSRRSHFYHPVFTGSCC